MLTTIIVLGFLVIIVSIYLFLINIGEIDVTSDEYQISGNTNETTEPKPKVTKSQLKSIRKDDLITLAKDEFDVEFPKSLNKPDLINKIYELYNQ